MSKYQAIKLSLCAAVLFLALPAHANNVVTANQDVALSFTQPPRLAEAVLTVTQTQQRSLDDVYWPAAGLYRMESQQAQAISDLQPIRDQIAVHTGERRQQWQTLYQALSKMVVGERVAGPIDPDITRITPDTNPALDGNWHLQLPKRPTKVTVLGAVSEPGSYPWNARQAASDYIQQAKTPTLGVSQVWVLSPTGERTQYPVAYWNHQHRDILPGSVIYIPLPSKTIKGQAIAPNQHVLTFLQNRLIRP